MKCRKCNTENGAEARFCGKCGSNLSDGITQPNSSPQAKPGGFYRFCLGGAAIWTSFLLGSFLAMGVSMVSHGASNPEVFGLGFGLGFVLFAGVWFIGTVVLLLLAMATKPSPTVPWSRTSKLATALLALSVFIWPVIKASTAGTSSTSPPSAGGNPVTAVAQWRVSEDASAMDGSKQVVLTRDAENDIQGSYHSERPSLIVRCKEGKTEVYMVTGMSASVEYDTESHTVRVRFDDGRPTTQHWSESTDHNALFAPNAVQLAKQLVRAKTLVIEFTPFDASPAVTRFNLQGLGTHLEKVASACGWQAPHETK